MPRLPGIGDRISQRLRELGYRKGDRLDVSRLSPERAYRPQYVYAWVGGRTLAVGDAGGRVYTGEEGSLLVAFADQAAVALDNARRHRELEERLRALEARPQG